MKHLTFTCHPPIYLYSVSKQLGKIARILLQILFQGFKLERIEALSADLVIISQAELQVLTLQIPESHRMWIGMHRDPKDKSRWLWVHGSHPTYTYWYKGEPNSLYEECAKILSKVHGWKWTDLPCSATHPYVCET